MQVGKKQATIGLANTNKLIKFYQGATGVKTGFTAEAKYCLSASAQREDTHLVAATLGAETSPERFNDAATLLNYGFANYESVPVIEGNQLVDTIVMEKASNPNVELVAQDTLKALSKKGQEMDINTKIVMDDDLVLPIEARGVVGVLEVYNGEDKLGEVNLITKEKVEKATFLQMLERIMEALI